MSKVGTLQTVNIPQVCIDGVWYDGVNVTNYIPQRVGIQVEFNHDANNVLLFIREKTAFTLFQQYGLKVNKLFIMSILSLVSKFSNSKKICFTELFTSCKEFDNTANRIDSLIAY